MNKSYLIIRNNFIGLCLLAIANAGYAKGGEDNPTVVTGAVDVTVTNTPDVYVVNTPAIPEPFQANFGERYSAGDGSWSAFSDEVEAGKTLVVEYISISYLITASSFDAAPACRAYTVAEPNCNLNDVEVIMRHIVPLTSAPDYFFDGTQLEAATPILMYVNEGQALCVRCELPDDSTVTSSG